MWRDPQRPILRQPGLHACWACGDWGVKRGGHLSPALSRLAFLSPCTLVGESVLVRLPLVCIPHVWPLPGP